MASRRSRRLRRLSPSRRDAAKRRAMKAIGLRSISDEDVLMLEASGTISCYRTAGGRYFVRREAHRRKYGGAGRRTDELPAHEFLDALREHDPPLCLVQHPKDPSKLFVVYKNANDRRAIQAANRVRERQAMFGGNFGFTD